MVLVTLILFIIQLVLVGIIVSSLLSFNINTLILTDEIEDMNTWISQKNPQVKEISKNIIFIIKKCKDKLIIQRKKMLVSECLNLLEWLLIFSLKRSKIKFILGLYKLSKFLYRKLLLIKNMV